MDVRERDDELGWDDLPGGLAFTEEAPPPPPPVRRPPLRRALGWLLVLALLTAAALAAVRWTGNEDVRAVAASSATTYTRVLTAVGAARDVDALASAAALAPRAAERLEGDRARLGSARGERRAALAAQVEAERAVLVALAPLERLEEGPLRVWGSTHERLAGAVADEARSRAALREVDGGAARRLPDTAGALRSAATTVGAALVADVQKSAGDLLDELAAAQRTADLRAVAQRAAVQGDAVRSAQDGLGEDQDGTVLRAFAAGLDAVRDLRGLEPGTTAGWPAVRERLREQLRVVADADGSLAAGSVRARLPLVLQAVDGLVARAAEAHAAWQPVHDAAVAQQATDRAALAQHAEAVRAAAGEWAGLRAALTDLQEERRLDVATAALRLDARSATADRVLSALRAATPPPGTADRHGALVASAEPVAAALVSAFDALRQEPCQDCPAREHPAWRGLSRAQDQAGSWDGALAAWEQAVTEATAAVDARQLPPPPDA